MSVGGGVILPQQSTLHIQWNVIKLRRHLGNRQTFRFRHKVVGKIQKVRRRGDEYQECKGLRKLQQNGKGKSHQPIGDPLHFKANMFQDEVGEFSQKSLANERAFWGDVH